MDLPNADRAPLRLDAEGWLEVGDCRRVPSPHFDARPEQTPIDLLVIHNISLPAGVYGGPYIESLFAGTLDCSAHPSFSELQQVRVSAHFLVRRDGEIVQFVSTFDRAWHAGVSEFCGRSRCNDFSIGIELEGCDEDEFELIQIAQTVTLIAALCELHPTLRWVAGHSDIAPGRKSDPGPCFNWPDFLHQLDASGLKLARSA